MIVVDPAAVVVRWPSAPALRQRVSSLRADLSAYDACYVALAEALECPLLTRAERLVRAVGHSAEVRLR